MTGGRRDTRDEAGGAGDRRRALETRGEKNTEREERGVEIARGGGKRRTGGEVERRLQVDGLNFKSGASSRRPQRLTT